MSSDEPRIDGRFLMALQWIIKCDEDSTKAKFAITRGDYGSAYGYATRMRESIRQLLEVDRVLRESDTDVAERERIAKDSK